MKRILLALLAIFALSQSPSFAASTRPGDMTSSSAIVGTQIVWCPTGTTADFKCTFTQIATFINSLFSGDFTVASGGAATLKNTGPGATGPSGSATIAPVITIDAQGRVTALTTASITPPVGNITGFGTGVATALGVNVGSAGSFIVNGGALGTPSSGTGTNITGVPVSTGISGLGTGVATSLAANLNASGGIISPTPAAAGDIIYWNGSAWTKFAGNNSGSQVLQENSSGVPSWVTASGAGTVTSITPGAGLSTSQTSTVVTPITSTGTLYPDSAYSPGFVGGLTLSNDGGTPNTILDIAAGSANDSTDVTRIKIGAFTKTTAGAWTSGTGNAGMGNGLTIAASTWYHTCLAFNGGTPDIWFDTSATCANKPAGISGALFRRIGSFKTDASVHILPFVQHGNEFDWVTPVQDVSTATLGTTQAAQTVASVPLGVVVNALFRGIGSNASAWQIVLSPVVETGTTLAGTPAGNYNLAGAAGITGAGDFSIPVNASQQINAAASGASTTLRIITHGWVEVGQSAGSGGSGTIASGATAMGTSAISSATCATVVTVAAANVATTDVLTDSFNGDPTAVTGYAPATTGMLTIIEYPTSGNVNFKVCNDTLASITPGAITLNWRVSR